MFALLRFSLNVFGHGNDARALYAQWLVVKSSRHRSYVVSNMLDLMFIIVKNAKI